MTRSTHAISILSAERDALAVRIDAMQADLKEAKSNLRSLEEAIAQLTGAPAPPLRSEGPTLKELILEQLDGLEGKTPLEIANAISAAGRETSNTSVSSILSRLRADGLADKDGDRWTRTEIPDFTKGSDAPTPEPFVETGPATGREKALPTDSPEGSIPSGSTRASARSLDKEMLALLGSFAKLDKDTPF
ncbi:MAG: hypothetical protein EOS36_21050 [Mesorhizobium sp.]|uniref:hypothetical protein n=1 Tax=Mesorhizobium sp. TaxID=1871066 RepID=UPI000FE755DC|nr:hypothetical protein [Mesorhizobium sp.]RWD60442.1 MAG: hypothetical protein EOS36_21050 [Mesorhizobium sp.]RWE42270.1 MAG: hypothetical protein EOS79_16520 [Mesorhizobium sp.]